MYLKRLTLRNFRNYEKAEVCFSPGCNFILGENGQGKTNLLEAISLISTGRSFRTHALADLITFGKRFFHIEAEFYKEGVTQTIKIYYDTKMRRVEHNETRYQALHALLGTLPSVFITPDDLTLITGSPSERRRFLDLHCAQTDPLYLKQLGRYFRALKQRNELLRSSSHTTLSTWEQIMATAGAYLSDRRAEAIHTLEEKLRVWGELLSQQKDTFSLVYRPSPTSLKTASDKQSHLQDAFQQLRSKEGLIGNTLIGAQRDDLSIELSNRSAKTFSSEGQKRSCLAALKLGQWELMTHILGAKPLLGIDDFGVQLDATRSLALHKRLHTFGQIFLTTPDIQQAYREDSAPFQLFTIISGHIHTDI